MTDIEAKQEQHKTFKHRLWVFAEQSSSCIFLALASPRLKSGVADGWNGTIGDSDGFRRDHGTGGA